MCMASIMWSIMRSQKLYKHGWWVFLFTRIFTDSREVPGKNHFWVTHFQCKTLLSSLLRVVLLPQVGRLSHFWSGVLIQLLGAIHISVPPLCPFTFSSPAALRPDFYYPWFSLRVIDSRLYFLVDSSICDNWQCNPLWIMSTAPEG